MINLKRAFILLLLLTTLFSISTFGYTGILDSFQGWDYTTAGKFAVNTFNLSDSDIYTEIRIDDAQRWLGGGTSGMFVSACKANIWGSFIVQQEKTFFKQPNDKSYTVLSYTGLATGTYKMKFAAYYADLVDFTGVVWDD